MPKISSQNVRVQHDDIDINIIFDVMYNAEYKFYVMIPEEYQPTFDLMTDADLKKFQAAGWSKTKYGAKTRGIVTDETESGCIKAYQAMIKHLMTSTIQKRAVIIVYYSGSTPGDSHHRNELYNPQHDEVKVEFSFTRCTETTAGDKKIYAIYGEREDYIVKGKMERVVTKVDDYHYGEKVIIDDTPANREFLERVYMGLQILNAKLKEFTANESNMLKSISAGQKLIN